MVKSIPSKITGEIRFPVMEGMKEDKPTSYSIIGLEDLKSGYN